MLAWKTCFPKQALLFSFESRRKPAQREEAKRIRAEVRSETGRARSDADSSCVRSRDLKGEEAKRIRAVSGLEENGRVGRAGSKADCE